MAVQTAARVNNSRADANTASIRMLAVSEGGGLVGELFFQPLAPFLRFERQARGRAGQ